MPDWVCTAGNTLLIPSGPQGLHLYVVLTEPKNYDGQQSQSCLSVCICTIRKGPYDNTCIIPAGAHPFIEKDSYIAYRYTRLDQAVHLEKCVQAGTFIPHDPVSPDLLTKIITGLHESIHTPNFLKPLI